MDCKGAKEALKMCRELMLYDPNNGVAVEYGDLNDDNGHYLCSVPEYRNLKQGDMVMVRNKRGEATAQCVCDSFEVSEGVLKALAARYGATLPLAPIIGTMKPEWW